MLSKEYWSQDFPRPLGPNDEDVDIFKDSMIPGKTLLLGCTKKLLDLSDVQIDLDPWWIGPNTITGNWLDNKDIYENILCDGGLCFTKELADGVLQMASKNCKVFITRTFTRRLPIMRIADYFPQPVDFKILPTKTIVFEDYSFYIWRF
jgi:hypothetical protein